MVCRVEKNRNYTTMSNYHLRDKTLSFKAKGLLSMCLSLPECWDYSIEGLVAISREGQTAVMNTIRELEEAGYIRRERSRTENGRLGKVEYIFYEFPQKEPPADSAAEEGTPGEEPSEEPYVENPNVADPDVEDTDVDPVHVDATHVENPGQIITDKLNTEEINTEEINNGRKKAPVRHRYGEYGNVLLSDEEMRRLQAEFPEDYQQRIERLSEYIASTGKRYKNHLATIRSWARRDKAGAEPAKTGAGKIRGTPYGCGAPGQSELDAVRRLHEKHRKGVSGGEKEEQGSGKAPVLPA